MHKNVRLPIAYHVIGHPVLRVNFGAKKESILWLVGDLKKRKEKRHPVEGFTPGPDSTEK